MEESRSQPHYLIFLQVLFTYGLLRKLFQVMTGFLLQPPRLQCAKKSNLLVNYFDHNSQGIT